MFWQCNYQDTESVSTSNSGNIVTFIVDTANAAFPPALGTKLSNEMHTIMQLTYFGILTENCCKTWIAESHYFLQPYFASLTTQPHADVHLHTQVLKVKFEGHLLSKLVNTSSNPNTLETFNVIQFKANSLLFDLSSCRKYCLSDGLD